MQSAFADGNFVLPLCWPPKNTAANANSTAGQPAFSISGFGSPETSICAARPLFTTLDTA